MITFLLFGSAVFFWLALIAIIALDIFFLEINHGWACSASLILFVGAVLYWGETSLFSWIAENPLLFFGGLAAYIPIGIIYGWKIEWPLFLKRKGLAWQEQRRDFLITRGVLDATLDTPVPEEHSQRWDRKFNINWRFASRNKGKIISLMSWWPVAMFRTLLREPFLTGHNLLAVRLQASADKQAREIGLLTDQDTAIRVRREEEEKREKEAAKHAREVRS